MKYVILWGDFENGYELIGTFEDMETARQYCEDYLREAQWDIILLQEPAKIPSERG